MKLLLPIDGSSCSMKTIEWAAGTFSKAQTEYYLLMVISVIPDMIKVEYDVIDATKALHTAKEELERLGCTVAKIAYVFGDTVDRICEYADEIQADQVILGSHGKTGLAKILMGSTSIAVMERCKHPVILHCNVNRSPALQPKPVNTLL
jgi:nucleotide-binding universal stress UspA family protein